MRSALHIRVARWALLAGALMLLTPAVADATTTHGPIVMAGIPVLGGLASDVGSVFSSIGGAVLGAFSWTIGLATKFILTTVAALVHMLIPESWLHKGLEIMEWIVSVPDYGGKIASPGGGTVYGFGAINDLRGVFGWLGMAIAPLTLVYATSRSMIGEGDPIGVPVLRTVVIGVVIVSYPYWWDQGAALVNQITNVILSVPQVASGLDKLMEYAVGGVALGGWQLIDLGLMGAVAVELLGLIFMKVVVILLGAWLYATGPVMIGLVPTRQGSALARAWVTAVIGILALGIAWASLFAVGAVLINDSSTAGPLLAGNTGFGSLIGGVLLAVAGLASLWLCLKVAREAGSLLRMQLGGLLALGGRGASSSSSVPGRVQATTGRSLRDYGQRLAAATSAGAGELGLTVANAGPAGAVLARSGRAIGQVGRRGLIGTAAVGAQRACSAVSPAAAATFSRSRAGAVAVRMGRAGTASWQQIASQQQRAANAEARRSIRSGPGGRPGAGGGGGTRSSSGSRAKVPSAIAGARQARNPGAAVGALSRSGSGAQSSQQATRPWSTQPATREPPSGRVPGTDVSQIPGQTRPSVVRSAAAGNSRLSGPVGASHAPSAAVAQRRFRRGPRPVVPAPAVPTRPSPSPPPPRPIAPEPRTRRPLGARLIGPLRNRKAGK